MLNFSFSKVFQSLIGLGVGKYVNRVLLGLAVISCIWAYTNAYLVTKEAADLRKANAKLQLAVAANQGAIETMKMNFDKQSKLMSDVYQAGLDDKISAEEAKRALDAIEKDLTAPDADAAALEGRLNDWQKDMDECMEEASGGPASSEGNKIC